MRVRVVKDPDGVAELASASIARWLGKTEGVTNLGVAGGGTPRATYARLREEEVDWGSVHLWLGDERWVPPDDNESNARMIDDTLASHVSATFHRPPWGHAEPSAAAASYEAELGSFIASDEAGRMAPDLVLLGIGDDGHTASLFPGSSALAERERDYVANWVEAKGVWRLTATLPLLWAARRIAFLVTGGAKADIVAEILEGDGALPAAQVGAGAQDVTWFLDEAAASRLHGDRRPT